MGLNTRQAKKSQNTLEIDTLDYIKEFEVRLFVALDRSENKADAWREKRDADLISIKDKVYNALETVLAQQADLQRKYLDIKRDLEKNTFKTEKIEVELREVQDQLKNIGKIELSTLAKIAWGGITALVGACLSLGIAWLSKKL